MDEPQPGSGQVDTLPPEGATGSTVRYQVLELATDETHLYPRFQDVAVETIADSDTGIVFTLTSDLPSFSHFTYAVDGGSEREASEGRVVVEIEDRHALDSVTKRISIWAHDEAGVRSPPREIQISYHSPDLYAANGSTLKGGITIDYSDVPRVDGHVSDWIIDEPTEDEIAFARATWGSLVEANGTPTSKARALGQAILDALDEHRGVPSDWMATAPPFDQYRRVIAGDDHVWCDNFAKIFVRAAVALGIPARIIEMPSRAAPGTSELEVFWADGHTTTEIFDEVENRWIWIDLTFSALGAEMDGMGPLQVASLHRYFADPNVRAELLLDLYDAKGHAITKTRHTPQEARRRMMRFFNREQHYEYRAREGTQMPSH